MENNRPRGRERHVSGPGKKVEKHGKGLGSGPVGEAGGYDGRQGRRMEVKHLWPSPDSAP